MEIQFTYMDGQKVDARILPIDRIMFERKFHLSAIIALTVERKEEHFLWLGWHALNRQGQAGTDFDAWLASVTDYDAAQDPEVPTDAAASITP